MSQNALQTLLILVGAALFLHTYYVFPRRFDRTQRPRADRLVWYTWVDHYLKVTTLAIPLLTLNAPGHWLLLVHASPALRWLGLAVAGVGLLLLVWSMRTLADQFSPCDFARTPSEVVHSGPYRWVRHPIYSGNLVLLAGLAIMTGSLWLMVNWIVLLSCYWLITHREEAALHNASPEYAQFAATRGRFLPRLRGVRDA